MIFLVVSDIHDRVANFINVAKREEYDAIIVAGDFTYFRPLNRVLEIVHKVREVTNAPIYFVPGNCDPVDLLNYEDLGKDFYNLHLKLKNLGDIVLIGIGGSNITPFSTNIEFSETELARFTDKLVSFIKDKPFLLVTHVPPYNTVDKLSFGEPAGSRIIRSFVEKWKPIAVFSGHIHESRGISYLGKTVIVNPGPLMRGYYALANVKKDNVGVELKHI